MEKRMTELHYAIMSKTGFTAEEADEVVQELKKLVKEGENVEDLLMDINIDPIYRFYI